ncbi:MAG TPA: histidine--tRNA ligase [Gemmataceae bacterium]|jgi:histidyl-tRNA synthetase|nr:histidine--tRNA ligase [Gemmataceae bacterium]
MSSQIQPRTLKGFRDYLPELMIPRERMLETARQVYRSYGFAPIDTPALEYSEILLGKGGAETDRQLYRFRDHGDRDVALRFDLTVPFARFAAEHIGKIGIPFKRYHMGVVWRGENTQHGRYREFMQCDFDTIGTTSNAADCETALVIYDLMAALDREFGFGAFEICINNRLLLNGLLEELGLADKAKALLIALDKLGKAGADAVAQEMVDKAQVQAEQARRILALAQMEGSNEEVLRRVEANFGRNPKSADGVQRLRELLAVAKMAGVPEGRIRIDLSIARGLDYYTGTIYETFLKAMPNIGSVCSGGRYDNLANLYAKQVLPGIGASLGLDRLLAALEELGKLDKTTTPAPVIVFCMAMECLGDYQRLARMLRASGIGVEVYPDAKKIGQQFQYAERRGHRVALIAGPSEFTQGVYNVKDLAAKEQLDSVPEAELVEAVRKLLAPK